MKFEARIVIEKSFDPNFLINFSYTTDTLDIKSGTAEIIRKAPKPVITYDESTESKMSSEDRMHIEYGLLNTVIDYIIEHGVVKSWRGNIILKTV